MSVATLDELRSVVDAAAATTLDEPSVLEAAERVVADIIAVAHAGGRTEMHAALVERMGSDGPATALGDSPRAVTPHVAALLNATAAVALELDESLPGGGHPGAHVVPAALAEAQRRGASGRALLDAVVRGYEVSGRLHRSHRMRFPAHPHGAIGAIGAAVAVASLRDGDPLVAARVAATLPVLPSWAACFEGAPARNVWAGLGAMIGVLANELADSGFVGATEDPLQALALVSEPATSLDEGPLVLSSALRAHAVAGPLQSAVEATLALDLPADAMPDDVLVETVAANEKFAFLPPGTDLAARFSLPHAVAVALIAHRPLRPESFAFDPSLLALAERVRVVVAGDLQEHWPATTPARVSVTVDGRPLSAECPVPAGHPRRPLDREQLAVRWRELLGGHDALAERLGRVAELTDVNELLAEGDR